ncbi:MAG: hypothetical protein K0B06_04390 [Brevefilum sp.]|nr:hypothetical protein [Brevefilum sp.]
MTITNLREQLHKQIDRLPDELIEQIADFTSFIMARRQISQGYTDWDKSHWRKFSLEQFLREEDEVEYSLKDAREIYRP